MNQCRFAGYDSGVLQSTFGWVMELCLFTFFFSHSVSCLQRLSSQNKLGDEEWV